MSQLPFPRAEDLPALFGRYRVLKLLGRGGMGSVYLAHDTQLDRPVALKIPNIEAAEGSQVLERFLREARSAATIRHANICPLYEIGEIDGVPYLTMAFIDGKPLSAFVAAKPLALRQVALLVRKLAQALAEAHKCGVIHRDLKPANIMIDKNSEPIIMDFGLARRSRGGDVRLTQQGAMMGTPAYMPPEQISGHVEAMGPASDVYSLGVVLYELLTGQLPFHGDVMAILSQALLDEPPPPSKFRSDVAPDLEAICLKAMAKKIEDRYASMNDMATALLEHLRGKTQTADPLSATVATAKALPETPTIVAAETMKQGNNVAAPDGPRSAAKATAPIPAKKTADKPSRRRKSARRRGIPLWVWIAGAAGLMALVLLVGGGVILYEIIGKPRNTPIKSGDSASGGRHEPDREREKPPLLKAEESRLHQWPDSNIYCVAISPDNRYYLATGDRDKTRVWSIETGLQVNEFRGFFSTFTSDGGKVVVWSNIQSACSVYQTGTWKLDTQFTGGEDLDNCWFLPKTDLLVSATASGYRLWTLKGEELNHWKCDPTKSNLILYTADGRYILMSLDGTPWHAIDVATRAEAPGFGAIAKFGNIRGFTSDNQQVYALSANKLEFYEVKTGTKKQTFSLGDGAVEALVLSANGNRVLTAHNDHTIRLWDVGTGNELCRLSAPEIASYYWRAKPLAISADGKYACAGGAPGRVYLWRLP